MLLIQSLSGLAKLPELDAKYYRGQLYNLLKSDKQDNLTPGPSKPKSRSAKKAPSKTTAEILSKRTGVPTHDYKHWSPKDKPSVPF